MTESAKPIRVLLYADAPAMVPQCVAAAEMLRRELDVKIVMTVLDRETCSDEAFEKYEVYDHEDLFRWSSKLVPSAARKASDASETDLLAGQNAIPVGTKRPRLGFRMVLARSIRKIPSCALNHYRRYRHIRAVGLIGQIVQACRGTLYVKRFLRNIRPDIIILAEDNIERLSSTFVYEGRKQGIPSIIIPFTIPNPLEPAKYYLHRKDHRVSSLASRLVSRFFPQWCYQLGDVKLLRLPAHSALVREAFGQSSPAPWILNRGLATKIAVDSEAQYDLYVRLGFPREQLSVVGDMYGVALYRSSANKQQFRSELLAKHGFAPEPPLILCGFPPNQFEGHDEEFEFQSYEALVDAWIQSFAALGSRANVLIRPHPRVPIKWLESFASAQNVRYTLQPTAELIPLCDLYVASISATIRWAIACGIPVFNYDTYRLGYGDFDGLDGVIYTQELKDFRDQLARFVDDPSFAKTMVLQQQSVMHRWGVIDGDVPRRLGSLVREVIGVERVQAIEEK